MRFNRRVLKEFLNSEPPHLAMIRAIEAQFYKKYLPLRGKVLDVGCGDGIFVWSVFERQKIDLGIDLDDSLWREAKERKNYKKVMKYDGKKIPINNESFDTVICNCVLEHVEDPENLVKEMARVTKSGGVFLATVVGKDFGDSFVGTKILGQIYKNWFNRKSIHVSCKNRKEWTNLFEKAGYKVIKMKTYFNYKGAGEFFEFTHYWGIGNLFSRKLTGKWTWGLALVCNKIWEKLAVFLMKKMKSKTDNEPYFFVVAEKIKT
jgi:2-polyprenyl-3-methyl-5-hydroxy-6-metoxy-1,4-benzoquinol methylase